MVMTAVVGGGVAIGGGRVSGIFCASSGGGSGDGSFIISGSRVCCVSFGGN